MGFYSAPYGEEGYFNFAPYVKISQEFLAATVMLSGWGIQNEYIIINIKLSW